MRPHASDMRGFTLLETLVALFVLSLVVLGLAQGLRLGLVAWDRQAAVLNRDRALDATDRTLRRLLAAMAPGDDPRAAPLLGTHDRMAFTTMLPAGIPAFMRLADIVIGVDGSHRLVMRWIPHLHARLLGPQPAREEVLLTGVADVSLAYFRRATAHQPAGWVEQWQDASLPELIRIHLVFANPRLRWPDVIVAQMRSPDEE